MTQKFKREKSLNFKVGIEEKKKLDECKLKLAQMVGRSKSTFNQKIKVEIGSY